MKILVCGGAGYIGTHFVRELVRHTTHSVVIVDSLTATHGNSSHVDVAATLEVGDVRDVPFLSGVFERHKPDAVVHMSASIVVPESVRDPLAYYDNNVVGLLRILEVMRKHQCSKIVFSSTAAVFGTPERVPIHPDDKKKPDSPYGDTKLVCEQILQVCDHAYKIRSVCLRYFNACGAHPDGDIGETHDPETHLIPLVLQVAQGKRPFISVYGTDYPTVDGTCVRDYVHVGDLAHAHIKAMEYLDAGGSSAMFNLGTSTGYSVRQVIDVARKVTGHPIPSKDCPRRAGDPAILVASGAEAKEVLGWKVQFDTLEKIIETAWNFHSKHPSGYCPAGAAV